MGTAPRPTVVIPSYWGRPFSEPFCASDDLYDHPTPVDEDGTLGRALESFRRLDTREFDVVVLGVSASEELRGAVEDKLAGIVAPFSDDLSIRVFSYSDLAWLHTRLRAIGAGGLADLADLRGYSNVRDACLIATMLTGSDVAVFFDDDEIVVDDDYLTRATENLGAVAMGAPVWFVAGYYLRPESDTYEIPPTTDWREAEWRGTEAMNASFEAIGRPPRLKKTPFTFGGNMVVHREVFSKCCFDPHVTRGEDIDYLVGAKMHGFEVFLDNQLRIKHLPPPGRTPAWRGFRENVCRFVYQRAKLKAQKRMPGMRRVALAELMPYPGAFLGPDLDDKIFKTCTLRAMDALARDELDDFGQWMETISVARFDAVPDFDPFDDYLARCARWRDLVAAIAADDEGRAEWRSGFSGG